MHVQLYHVNFRNVKITHQAYLNDADLAQEESTVEFGPLY